MEKKFIAETPYDGHGLADVVLREALGAGAAWKILAALPLIKDGCHRRRERPEKKHR